MFGIYARQPPSKINNLEIDNVYSDFQNISKAEEKSLGFLQRHCNKDFFIKKADKNAGPTIVGTPHYIDECYNHLNPKTYFKMTKEGKEILIADAIFSLQFLIAKYKNVLSKDEQIYLLSKNQNYAIPLFIFLQKFTRIQLGGDQ